MQSTDLVLRLGAFLGMFVLLAFWERRAPRRVLRFGTQRWRSNLSLTVVNTVSMRLLIPLGALGTATLAAKEQIGLFTGSRCLCSSKWVWL